MNDEGETWWKGAWEPMAGRDLTQRYKMMYTCISTTWLTLHEQPYTILQSVVIKQLLSLKLDFFKITQGDSQSIL